MAVVTQPRTLVDVWLPRQQRSWLLDAALVALFSAFVALTARIEIPLWPVPMTLQTLGVVFTGAALGSRRGVLALLLYLVEGGVGLPVFAGGASGVAYMSGPTAGYLVGFVAAAAVVGWLAERGWDRNVVSSAVAMLAGELAIYVFGLLWLARFVPASKLLLFGLFPFVIGDLIKLVAAALVVPAGWRLRGR
jgi:biotin transport system substrate-specific component